MIIRQCILVLLAIFLIMGCVGAVSAEGELKINFITPNLTEVYVNSPVTFTFDVENATIISIDYGDGNSGTDVTHSYSTAGNYTATLTATNSTNATVSLSSNTIVVTEPVIPLVASFTADPTSGTAPLDVQFTDTSSGTPTSWNWVFGDGDSSTKQNPSHEFVTNGTYEVKLTVNKDGVDSNTSSCTITVDPAPSTENISSVVLITGVTPPVYGATPDTTASSTTDGISNVTVSWNPNPTKFAAETQYTATIVVHAASGYVFNITKPTVSLDGLTMSESNVTRSSDTQLTITYTYPKTAEVEKILPTVTLKADVPSGTLPLTVKFTYSVSGWNNYTWTDGETSSTLPYMSGNLNHTYTKAGTYTANLTARNENGTTTKTVTITVNKVGLNAAFTASPGSGTSPLKVWFTDTSAGSPTTWLWDFGGLGSSTLKNPSFTFTAAGNYIVKLTILDGTGAADAYSSVISVHAPVITSTSTPAPTDTSSSLSMSYGTGNITSLIPAPLDVIKEFIRLFYTLLDMQNYVGVSNQTNTV